MKYLLFCVLLMGCTTPRNELSEVRYVTKKHIVMKIKNIDVTETRYYYFEGEKYPCEYIVMYDTLGKATAFYRGSAEGFIIYEKNILKVKLFLLSKICLKYLIQLASL